VVARRITTMSLWSATSCCAIAIAIIRNLSLQQVAIRQSQLIQSPHQNLRIHLNIIIHKRKRVWSPDDIVNEPYKCRDCLYVSRPTTCGGHLKYSLASAAWSGMQKAATLYITRNMVQIWSLRFYNDESSHRHMHTSEKIIYIYIYILICIWVYICKYTEHQTFVAQCKCYICIYIYAYIYIFIMFLEYIYIYMVVHVQQNQQCKFMLCKHHCLNSQLVVTTSGNQTEATNPKPTTKFEIPPKHNDSQKKKVWLAEDNVSEPYKCKDFLYSADQQRVGSFDLFSCQRHLVRHAKVSNLIHNTQYDSNLLAKASLHNPNSMLLLTQWHKPWRSPPPSVLCLSLCRNSPALSACHPMGWAICSVLRCGRCLAIRRQAVNWARGISALHWGLPELSWARHGNAAALPNAKVHDPSDHAGHYEGVHGHEAENSPVIAFRRICGRTAVHIKIHIPPYALFPQVYSARMPRHWGHVYIYKYTKHQKYYGPPFHDILNVVRLLESILEPVFRATWRMQSDHFQTNLPQCKRLHVETCSCPCFRQIFHGRRIFCISPALVHWSNTTHSWTLLSHVMTCLLWCCCKHIFCNNLDNGLWCAMHTNYNHSISASLVIVLIEHKS
jgi:hypothetical protein